MDNDDILDSIFDEDDISSNTGNSDSDANNSPNIQPVRLSRLATTGVLAAGIFILMIVILTVKGCSIQKKNSPSDDSGDSKIVNNIIESEVESKEQYADSTSKSEISSYEIQEVISSAVEEDSSVESVVSSENSNRVGDVTSMSSDSMNEEDGVTLSGEQESKGMVISKHIYSYDNSYIYDIVISLMIGDNAANVHYFCPKKTFDAVNSADVVNVVYQFDINGKYSIYSISK